MQNRKENPASKTPQAIKGRVVLTQIDQDLHKFYGDCYDLGSYDLDRMLVCVSHAVRVASTVTTLDSLHISNYMEVFEFISRTALLLARHREVVENQFIRMETLVNEYLEQESEVGNG